MEENITVYENAPDSEMEMTPADGEFVGEESYASENTEQEMVESAPGAEARADNAPERLFTREEFDEAVRRKSEYIRNGLKNDPIYQYAQSLVNQYSANGVSPQEAIEKAKAAQREQLIAELSADPKRMAEFFLNQQQMQYAPPPQSNVDAKAARLASELKTLEVQGALPKNFQLEAYNNADPELFSNAEQYGWKAAIKIADAKMGVANTAAVAPQPVRLPQSTRPTNSTQPAPPNFRKMTREQFEKYEAELDRRFLGG